MIAVADAIAIGARIENIGAAYRRGDLRAVRAFAQELLVYVSNVAETAHDDELMRRLVDVGAQAAHLIVLTEGRDAL